MKDEKLEDQLPADAQTEAPIEAPVEPRGRAKAISSYRSRYPDRFTEDAPDPDDDEMYDELMQSTSDYEGKVKGLSEANEKYQANSMKLVDLIDNNPDLAELFSTLNDDDDFLSSIKERKAKQAEVEANASETIKNVMAWQEEDGVSEEDRIKRVEFIVEVGDNIDKGIITRDIWDYAGNALNHDTDIEAAVVTGKNAAIDTKKAALKKDEDVFPDTTQKSVPTKKTDYTDVPEDNYNFSQDLKQIKK